MANPYQIPEFYKVMAARMSVLAASVPMYIESGYPVDNELAEIGMYQAILKAYASARLACGVAR